MFNIMNYLFRIIIDNSFVKMINKKNFPVIKLGGLKSKYGCY
jgi:hypothetical protein